MISKTYRVVENHHTVISENIPTEEQATEIADQYHKDHPGRYYEVQQFDPDQNRFIGIRLWKSRGIPFKWTAFGIM